MPSIDKKLYSNLYTISYTISVTCISIILLIVSFMGLNNTGALNFIIMGYIGIISSLILMMGIIYINMSNLGRIDFSALFPVLSVIFIILILIILLSRSFELIVLNQVHYSFNIFHSIITVFIGFSLYMLLNLISVKDFVMTPFSFSKMLLINIVMYILLIVISIILNYYITDG